MNKIYFYLLFIIGFSTSCSEETSKYQLVKEIAGDNYQELKRVLIHYRGQGEKLKAAKFLINNMGHAFSISPAAVAYREKVLSYVQKPNCDSVWFAVEDSLGGSGCKTCYDASIIKSDYIIATIEEAFASWKNAPWHDDIDFETFCQFILPYRVSNEPLSEWRILLKDKYAHLIQGITDPKQAYGLLYRHLIKTFETKSLKFPYTPDVLLLDKHMQGICAQRCIYIVSVMRALGIPASYDYIYYWANYSTSGHAWVCYTGEPGKTYTMINSDTIPLENNDFDASVIRAPWIPKHFKYKVDTLKRASKVYRKSYALETNLRDISDKTVPSFFRNPFVEDVSATYRMTRHSTEINTRAARNVYLCTFASIYDWQPVVKARQKQGKVSFTNIGGEIVYLLVYYDENKNMVPLSNPFILSKKNERQMLNPDSLHLQTMILRRKYVLYAHWLSRWSKMINARFEASDNPGFENAELLNIVKEIPDGITSVKFSPRKAYRYIRVQVRKDARPDIAEMAFYGIDTQNKLKGKLIYEDIELENVLKATDGDYTTHGGSRLEHYWFGLDLGEGNKEKVLSAEFCMRHDMNMVVAGDEYELFYYDYGWKSLGKQIPTCDSLVYTAPSNALFWLHNHTKGREERIFTYEDGRQVWW